MERLRSLQPFPTKHLKHFKDVLLAKAIKKEGLNLDDLTVSVTGNQLAIDVKPDVQAKYENFPIQLTFSQPKMEEVFEALGLASEYSQFELPRLLKYFDEQGIEYLYDDEGNELLVDTHTSTNVEDTTSRKQSLSFTINDGTFELPVVEKIAKVSQLIPLVDKSYYQYTVLLDVARHFISTDNVLRYMELAKQTGATKFMLHLSDNEAYRLPFNGNTQSHYDADDCLRIMAKAQELEIKLVLDIGAPAHMTALAELSGRPELFNENKQLDYTNTEACDFYIHTLKDALRLFDSVDEIHLGGDEFTFSMDYDHEQIDFFNNCLTRLRETYPNINVSIWNDGLTKRNIENLNKDIVVYYWSYVDRQENPTVVEQLKQHKATVEDLINAGCKVVNANSYFTYSLPSNEKDSREFDFATRNTLLNWSLAKWDSENNDNRYFPTTHFYGGFFGIWGEHWGTLDDTVAIDYLRDHMSAVGLIIHTSNNDQQRSTFVDGLVSNDFQYLSNDCYIDLASYHGEEAVIDYRWGAARDINLIGEDEFVQGSITPTLYIMGASRVRVNLKHHYEVSQDKYWKDDLSYFKYTSETGSTLYIGDEVEVIMPD